MPFDEHFFYQKGKTPDQLKVLWYILGVSARSYSSHRPSRRGDPCNVWSSGQRELIEIIKRCLKSEHAISYLDNGRTRQWRLQIVNEPLAIRLSTEYGLGENGSQHELPEDLPLTYLDHYTRGLYDSGGKCREYTKTPDNQSMRERVDLRIRLSEPLREGIYYILLRRANIPPAVGSYNTSPRHLIFTGDAIHRIADYMYRDWEFIESHGLYVQDKLDDIVGHAGFRQPGRIAMAMPATRT